MLYSSHMLCTKILVQIKNHFVTDEVLIKLNSIFSKRSKGSQLVFKVGDKPELLIFQTIQRRPINFQCALNLIHNLDYRKF
jgi:hypothetical protein